MKYQKLLGMVLLFALYCFSFSVYAESTDTVLLTCPTPPEDAMVNQVLALYQQLPRTDGNQIQSILDKDVIWTYEGPAGAIPFAGTYTGRLGVQNFWRAYFQALMAPQAELRYYLRQGNVVHLHWIDQGIVKSTGKRYLMETVQVWEFNEQGKLIRFVWYNDPNAIYNAFQPNTDPRLSLQQHPADYNIVGDGPVDGIPIIRNLYGSLVAGDLQSIIGAMSDNVVFIFGGVEGVVPYAGTYIGPEIYTFFYNLATTYHSNYLNIKTYLGDGFRVDAEWEEEIIAIPTGKIVNLHGFHSFVINSQGKILKFRSTNDTYKMAVGYSNN